MTNRPKVGGRRQPPGGRPPKGNVKFYCYLQPGIVETIDLERGELSRGEYITQLIETRTPPPRSARGETEETHMYTYRITVNDQDLHGIETVSYDHIGFDDDGNEIIEITTEREVSSQLDQSPAVVKYDVV